MAVQPIRACEVVGTISGNSPQTLELLEAAGQSYKAGDALALNAQGYAVKAVANGNAIGEAVTIRGIARKAGQNKASDGAKTLAYVPNDDTIFAMSVYHSTDANAVTALSDIGRIYGLFVDSNGILRVDKSSSPANAPKVRVLALHPGDAVGDKYGRLLVTFGLAARIKPVAVTVSAGATSGLSTTADPSLLGAVILGFYPTGNCDQHVDKIEIDTVNQKVKVTLNAAATAANTFNVVVMV